MRFAKKCVAFCAFSLVLALAALPAGAQKGTPVYKETKADVLIATKTGKSTYTFVPQKTGYNQWTAAHVNADALNQLCRGDEKKTVIIPKGSTVKIEYLIRVGNNTTIIADGATIIQTKDKTGVISTNVDSAGYNSVKNIKIQGGTWKNEVTKSGGTMMRFAMGSNITITGATVETNYEGHAIELIACKNVTVQKCKLIAKGKINADSVEDALQIDLATPITAPGIKAEGGEKYLKGQTCSNIKILNNTIMGSRGLCANYASKEPKYQNKFHDNITVRGNTITSVSAEALALLNTLNATVENNKIVSKAPRSRDNYSNGLNIVAMGTTPKLSKAQLVIKNNTIKGAWRALRIESPTTSGKYKKATIQNNKLYTKDGGKETDLFLRSVSKISKKKNKTYKW